MLKKESIPYKSRIICGITLFHPESGEVFGFVAGILLRTQDFPMHLVAYVCSETKQKDEKLSSTSLCHCAFYSVLIAFAVSVRSVRYAHKSVIYSYAGPIHADGHHNNGQSWRRERGKALLFRVYKL